MLNNHLTDEEVQQYVLDKESAETWIDAHVQQCEACKAKVETYRLLFSALGQQPEPAFDFNLSELVLAQLPSPKTRLSRDTIFVYLLITGTVVLTAAVAYIFRKDLLSLVPDLTPFLGYLIIPSVVIILTFLCMDMYKNFLKKMNALDFH